MPFVAACSYCPHQLQVPDQALGASVCCPKCGNYFTVAPTSTVPIRHSHRPAVQPSPKPPPAPKPAQPPPPAAEQPWWVTSSPDAAVAPAPPPAPPVSSPPLPPPATLPALPKFRFVQPPSSASEQPGWINTWGVFAFSFAALAMLLAAFSLPRYLALSCVGLGLVLGLAGAVMPRQEWKAKDAIWLLLGGGSCGLLLLVGWLQPGRLNDRWGMDFEVPEPDRIKQFVLPRAGNSEGKELRAEARVDAATQAIRQGDLLVRIESAEVKRLTPNDPPVLLLALHIENIGQLHMVTYHGQGGGEHPAVVRDSRGKELQRRDLGAQAHKLGQIKNARLLPNHETKDLIAVEAPWNGTAHVEVDLPAAAWGRAGVCKFIVSSNFLRR